MSALRSLLVVDDVPEILACFVRAARSYRTHALEIVALSDPKIALGMVTQRDFDLIVSDYRMPHVNGISVLTAARSRNPTGRRVLMTGYNEVPATPQEIDAAGLTTQLEKPILPASIVGFLQACFSEDAHAREASQMTKEEHDEELRATSRRV